MGENTHIQWATHSWNPWIGCTPVSAGCDHCYMFREQQRFGADPCAVRRTSPAKWREPYRWVNYLDACYQHGHGAANRADRTEYVFTCSWSDFFHPAADEWRDEAWKVIRETVVDTIPSPGPCGGLTRAHLTWLILTKRPERIAKCLPADWGDGYQHVWMGVTVENQAMADLRIPQLLRVPAAGRFVSYEPALGPVEFTPWLKSHEFVPVAVSSSGIPVRVPYEFREIPHIDWVIAGCESGTHRRPDNPDWYRSVRDQCQAAGVPYFLKQMQVGGQAVKMPQLDGQVWADMPKEQK